MRTVKNAMLVLIGFCLLSAIGCGGGTATGGSAGSAENLSFEGWADYVGGNYEKSEEVFLDALSLDPQSTEAFNGLGWLKFQMAGQEGNAEIRESILSDSRTNFQKATTSDPSNVDAWVGLSGLELHLGNWTDARDSANRALAIDPNYFSTHDNIDFHDVHLILAQAYFFLGSFVHTAETADPNNTLHHIDAVAPGYKGFYHSNGLSPADLITKIGELQGLKEL
jgi:tetratricopeptide (TPR) repeat protein